jgi:hypothetical protein
VLGADGASSVVAEQEREAGEVGWWGGQVVGVVTEESGGRVGEQLGVAAIESVAEEGEQLDELGGVSGVEPDADAAGLVGHGRRG